MQYLTSLCSSFASSRQAGASVSPAPDAGVREVQEVRLTEVEKVKLQVGQEEPDDTVDMQAEEELADQETQAESSNNKEVAVLIRRKYGNDEMCNCN